MLLNHTTIANMGIHVIHYVVTLHVTMHIPASNQIHVQCISVTVGNFVQDAVHYYIVCTCALHL